MKNKVRGNRPMVAPPKITPKEFFKTEIDNLKSEYDVREISVNLGDSIKDNFTKYKSFGFIKLPYEEIAVINVGEKFDINTVKRFWGNIICFYLESLGKALDFCDKYEEILNKYNNLEEDIFQWVLKRIIKNQINL